MHLSYTIYQHALKFKFQINYSYFSGQNTNGPTGAIQVYSAWRFFSDPPCLQ